METDFSKKVEKKKRRQERSFSSASPPGKTLEIDPLSGNYGDVPLSEQQSCSVSGRVWTHIKDLGEKEGDDVAVLIRGNVQTVRVVGKRGFVLVREKGSSVQCVVELEAHRVSKQMLSFIKGLTKESVVDVQGDVVVPYQPVKTASIHNVEIQVRKVYCINRASSPLPFNIEDAARNEAEIEKALEEGKKLVRVNQDTRLDNRFFDLRIPVNQAVFRIKSQIGQLFRNFLLSEDFIEIHTPKLLAGSSEGGSAVFELQYNGELACLAQSSQLHKQMAIRGNLGRVFEIGPAFRAEKFNTHRHLCEFIGMDVEMEIKEHYSEVMDLVDKLFVAIFDGLNENCQKELEVVQKHYDSTPLKYLKNTLRIPFEEGIRMLQGAGFEVDPMGDLNTEAEKKLGQLVLEKYETEFYILYRYPLAVRPFFTMPCHDYPAYSNSFDALLRGEEIISGSQRVHVEELLTSRAEECGIDVLKMSSYIDSFRYGVPLHGGFGAGLERVVMLFCGIKNIRNASLFPRDSNRVTP